MNEWVKNEDGYLACDSLLFAGLYRPVDVADDRSSRVIELLTNK